jgi:hypothetical protein
MSVTLGQATAGCGAMRSQVVSYVGTTPDKGDME